MRTSFSAIFLCFTLFLAVSPALAQVNKPNSNLEIKIGLLLQDSLSVAVRQGAELAIQMANKNEGTAGRKFRLVVRSMEGLWGTGSKQAVNLIADENVWAMVGSHDGRNAHLVEQVAAKARVLFVSARASDPTLSQAFVPWFFNCVPNDNQQAEVLFEDIYVRKQHSGVAIVGDGSYDTNMSVKCLLKRIEKAGKSAPLRISLTGQSTIDSIAERVNKGEIKCIVLIGRSAYYPAFIERMRILKMDQNLYGNLSFWENSRNSPQEMISLYKISRVESEFVNSPKKPEFWRNYRNNFRDEPTEAAAYAFDATEIVVEAIRNASYERDKLLSVLAKMKHPGATGLIQFDQRGNRLDLPVLMQSIRFELKDDDKH